MSSSGRVIVADCPDYEPENVSAAVREILSGLEPLPIGDDQTVLLKPNCLSSGKGPKRPVNTRVEVVEAVGRYLLDSRRVKLVIADSGGLGSYGRTEKGYARMGYPAAAERLGAELVNPEQGGLISLTSPLGQVVTDFQATDLLDRIDVIVNLPKLKTHLLTGITAALKNPLGLLPGGLKRSVHAVAPSPDLMARALIDLYAAFKPAVHLTDAVICMEGQGPSQGKARPVGRLLGSLDGVALDYVSATMIGLDPARVELIVNAAANGLGAADRAAIDLRGIDWPDLPVPAFELPLSFRFGFIHKILPRAISGWFWDRFTEAKPYPVAANCLACGLCVEACPAGALNLANDRLTIDKSRCIECYCCVEHCPAEGLKVPRGPLDRLWRAS